MYSACLAKTMLTRLFPQAVEKLDPQTRFLERFQVANALEGVGRYDEIVSVLEGYVDRLITCTAPRLASGG